VLWRTCWGTNLELGEHIKNLMVIHWELKRNMEHIGNQGKMEKKKTFHPTPPPPNLQGKSKAPRWHAWAFPLAA